MSLALCMIVKDEAKNLAACVESVRELVDEIVIVDTGSGDGTERLAESLGAKVYYYEWCDDFAAARNFALSKVSAKWVLTLDADERISEKDHERIRLIIASENIDGCLLLQRHYLPGSGYDNWRGVSGEYPEMEGGYYGFTENFALRLYRIKTGVMWSGRIHEIVVCADRATRWTVIKTDIVIHHYGKVAPKDELDRKKTQYLELTRKKAEESPDDAKAQFELGIQLHELGRWDESVEPFTRAFELDPAAYNKALYYIGNVNYKLGRFAVAQDILSAFLRMKPDTPDALVTFANVESALGNNAAALAALDKAIGIQGDLFSAWFNKGVLLLKVGDYAVARECFIRSLELMPGFTSSIFGKWQTDVFLGHIDQAAKEMLIWIDMSPEIKAPLKQALRTFLGRRDFALLDKAFGRLAEKLGDAEVYAALGAARLALGRMDDAEYFLRKAIEADENRNEARINLAQIKEIHRRDSEGAIDLYEQALLREPGNELCLQRLSALRHWS